MNKIILFIGLMISSFSMAQDKTDSVTKVTDTINKPWKLSSLYGANGTQSAFINWNAGGRNNISLSGYVSASADYEQNRWKWDNDLSV
ncbi:MAG: DUF3078 domain-containing protein, partial [Crocinitomicaceae bacterium]|nr:DUF3078 domain-containing protein [Crocinitomicaceae bacterium]